MNENNRLKLQKGDRIRLFRSQDSSDEWEIIKEVGEGGSAICYEAVCGNKTGRLKEFYPWQYGGNMRMKRTASHQLLPFHPLKVKQFHGLCDVFAETYLKLEKAKKTNKNNEVLNNFVPPYEVLYGLDENGVRGSVYIWTPDDKQGIGFDTYLAEVRKNPDEFGWKKLYEIVCIFYTLTDCVRVLHEAGFLHLDLKPSNFLIPFTGGRELNTRTISLFDVNTLYDIDSSIPMIAGSKGTQAPEVRKGRADNRSDIYSIGGMLFQAVIVDENDDDLQGRYFDGLYEFIEYLVEHSTLLRGSDFAGDRYVRYWLKTILKKCLARNPASRYGCCEELMKDLEGLRTFLEYYGAKQSLDMTLGEAGCQADISVGDEKRNEPAEQRKNLLYSTEIRVPFSAHVAEYKMLELEQDCSIGIDFSYDFVQIAAAKEKEGFLVPLDKDGNTELSTAVYIQNGDILIGEEALALYKKDPAGGAKSMLSALKERKNLVVAGRSYPPLSFLFRLFKQIRQYLMDEWIGGIDKVTAVLALPVDIDAEEIDLICRIAAGYGIYIRRVIDRTAAIAAAAYKASDGMAEYGNILACLYDGDTFSAAAFDKRCDFDLKTRKTTVSLREIEIGFAQKVQAENCLDVLQDMISPVRFFPEKTAVIMKYSEKARWQIARQAEKKGFSVIPDFPEVLPCYGAMFLNDMMMMLHSEIPAVYCVCPFHIDVMTGSQLLGRIHCDRGYFSIDRPFHSEISFDLPDTEEVTEVHFLRKTFGGQEKVVASIGIPGSRYLCRKVYIQADIEQNHNMVFKIEVVEWS
ncbi:MAG: hypothetical protein MR278_01550 [Bacteroidales bacterium]|nr:hypothetical protein [Anaerotignum sp.]MCI5678661.1 hypothetical protein [Bacteroidales bacterium]MDY3926676.1 hypothetical protein [Anaerotignum sp.]